MVSVWAAAPAVAEVGEMLLSVGAGLLFVGGSVVALPPPPPQPAMAISRQRAMPRTKIL